MFFVEEVPCHLRNVCRIENLCLRRHNATDQDKSDMYTLRIVDSVQGLNKIALRGLHQRQREEVWNWLQVQKTARDKQ